MSARHKIIFLFASIVLALGLNCSFGSDDEPKLLHLAKEHFANDLSSSEQLLFQAASIGGSLINPNNANGDLSRSEHWPEISTIRADRLAWIFEDPAAAALVNPGGVNITGYHIVGILNLTWANVQFPLIARKCIFTDSIILRQCHLRGVYFEGSQIIGLLADGIEVDKDVFLCDGFKARGAVHMPLAKIGGEFNCSGGSFQNENASAIAADSAKIGHSVSFSDGFEAAGSVSLHGASVGGDVVCEGGRFKNPNGIALDAEGINIDGNALLGNRTKMEADGEVRFQGANIGGGLSCGGRFTNLATNGYALNMIAASIRQWFQCSEAQFTALKPDGIALAADGANIIGNVGLAHGFKAEGIVRFVGTCIGSRLDCSGAQFSNPGGVAFSAEESKVGGAMLLSGGCKAEGEVLLSRALIGGDLIFSGSELSNTNANHVVLTIYEAVIGGNLNCINTKFIASKINGWAIFGDMLKIKGAIAMGDGFVSQGDVRLLGATIGSDFDCGGGQFLGTGVNGWALILDKANVGGDLELNNNFKAEGTVQLLGASVDGEFMCDNGHFFNSNGMAILADTTTFQGGVLLCNGFTAEGTVSLGRAKIGKGLICDGGSFKSPEGCALRLQGAIVNGDVSLGTNFVAQGEVDLQRVNIDGNIVCVGARCTTYNIQAVAINANGASVGGAFDCGGAHFLTIHKKGIAFSARHAKINSDLVFGNGFKAEGEVLIPSAIIGGNLECAGGHFQTTISNGYALAVFSSRIENSVHLRDGFEAVGSLDFDATSIGHYFSMANVVSPENLTLDLRNAKIGILNDSENSWPKAGNLNLDNLVYDEIFTDATTDLHDRKRWLRLQPQNQFLPQPYEQLANILRKMGKNDEAKEILIEKMWEQHRHAHWYYLEWWWNLFFGLTAGFGYNPSRSLLFIVLFICLGKVLFAHGREYGLIVDSNPDAKNQTFNAWIFSIESFVPLFKLGTIEHWQVDASLGVRYGWCKLHLPKTGILLSGYLFLHKILGWLLAFFLIQGLTGLLRT